MLIGFRYYNYEVNKLLGFLMLQYLLLSYFLMFCIMSIDIPFE
jgi:hypothetical protein